MKTVAGKLVAFAEPSVKEAMSSSCDSTCLSYRHFDCINKNKSVLGCIGALFNRGCPAAIARLVVSIIINSVNRCSVWLWTHILKKLPKVHPPITDGYSSPTITMPLWVALFENPIFHVAPRFVFSLLRKIKSVSGVASRCNFNAKASTRLRFSRSKIASVNLFNYTAIAQYLKRWTPLFSLWIKLNRSQPSKFFPDTFGPAILIADILRMWKISVSGVIDVLHMALIPVRGRNSAEYTIRLRFL